MFDHQDDQSVGFALPERQDGDGSSSVPDWNKFLPPGFSALRPAQKIALDWIHEEFSSENPPECLALHAPTGSGKSLIYVLYSLTQPGRTLILTSTKALQDQITADFPMLADCRGADNYHCPSFQSPCSEGKLRGCTRNQDCGAVQSKLRFRTARRVVTNYQFYAAMQANDDKFTPFDLIVCDEGHDAAEEMIRSRSVQIGDRERMVLPNIPIDSQSVDEWKLWAGRNIHQVAAVLAEYESMIRTPAQYHPSIVQKYRIWLNIERAVVILTRVDSDFICLHRDRRGIVTIEPFWLPEVGSLLQGLDKNFRTRIGRGKVLIFSATLQKAYVKSLDFDRWEYLEIPSTWPRERNLIYSLGSTRYTYRNEQSCMQIVAVVCRQIAEARPDDRGLIHTVSYPRSVKLADYLRGEEDLYSRIIQHQGGTGSYWVERLRNTPAGILISPSMTTGIDLPDDACRFNVAIKVPFPDASTPSFKYRSILFEDYAVREACVSLEQSMGRGCRHENDWCQNFILDSQLHWILGKGYLSRDFESRVVRTGRIPKPFNLADWED